MALLKKGAFILSASLVPMGTATASQRYAGGESSSDSREADELAGMGLRFVDAARPIAAQMTGGAVLGFCTGVAMRTVGGAVAATAGLGFCGVQALASQGYLKVDWERVERDVAEGLKRAVESDYAEQAVREASRVLTYDLPSGSGFGLGVMYGLGLGGSWRNLVFGASAMAAGPAVVAGHAYREFPALRERMDAATPAVGGMARRVEEQARSWDGALGLGAISSDPLYAFERDVRSWDAKQMRGAERELAGELRSLQRAKALHAKQAKRVGHRESERALREIEQSEAKAQRMLAIVEARAREPRH